ncbi:transposase [Streptomyces xinghaiensis]|uniref:transposase n=1 Tax=Streptomyces xinghaiensis TaxID=1038928 RepID=UPI003446CF2A
MAPITELVEDVFTALDEWTAVVPGTEGAVLIVPSPATSLAAVLGQRELPAGRIEEPLEARLLSQILISMPGVGISTGARILIEVGTGSSFPTAAHLAAQRCSATAPSANPTRPIRLAQPLGPRGEGAPSRH